MSVRIIPPSSHPPSSTIQTQRLILRAWLDEDRERFAAMNADPAVARFLPAPLTATQSHELLARIHEHFDTHGYGLYAVERRDDASVLGWVGLQHAPFHAEFTPAIEIGWRLTRDAWGAGYASEAARAVIEHAFTQLGIDELVSFTTAANLRSRSVMHRIGMQRDLDGDFVHPGLAATDPLAPHTLYRLRRADWRVEPAPAERGHFVHDMRQRYSFELRPDAALDASVRELAAALEAAGLIEAGACTAARFHPHVTLARAACTDETAALAARDVIAAAPGIVLDRAGTFGDGRIIYLTATDATPMCAARVELLDRILSGDIDPVVQSRGWTPHVTVAYAVPKASRAQALALVAAALPLQGEWATLETWDLDVRPTRRTGLHRCAPVRGDDSAGTAR